MKTTKQISIMMAVVLLSVSIISCNPQPNLLGQKTITLYVNTDSINQNNLDSTCNFGQPKGVSNKDYLTEVKFDEKITWIGVSSSNAKVKVKIKKISYVTGAEILTEREINNSLFSRVVHGKVKNGSTDLKEGDIEKYLIEFKVKGKTKRFIIDPKLRIL